MTISICFEIVVGTDGLENSLNIFFVIVVSHLRMSVNQSNGYISSVCRYCFKVLFQDRNTPKRHNRFVAPRQGYCSSSCQCASIDLAPGARSVDRAMALADLPKKSNHSLVSDEVEAFLGRSLQVWLRPLAPVNAADAR